MENQVFTNHNFEIKSVTTIHILVDWKKKEKFFLEKEFDKMNINYRTYDIHNYSMKDRTNKYRILILYIKYLLLAYKVLKKSKKNDILICWNFTTSIACGWISKLLLKKRMILALNIIAPKRNKLLSFFRRIIFHPVMNMQNYFITVNSDVYIQEYSKRFKISNLKFFTLSDPIQTDSTKEFRHLDSYVFVGGEAQRDWKTLFESCKLIPHIKFVCVARKKYYNNSLTIPVNVNLFFDIDYKTFYNYMENSSLVVIPLKSQIPSGLIILLKAALMQKPIIATSTPSTRNYLINMKTGLLVEQENQEILAKKINLLYHDVELKRVLARNLLDHVIEHHSQENYAKRLVQILSQISPSITI